MRTLGPLPLALWLALVPVASRAAVAEHDEFASLQAQIRVLASPARPAEVQRLVADPRFESADASLRLVLALRTAGGHAAADGLLHVLRHGDLKVRVAALRGLADLGLRSERVAKAVRKALASHETAEARAAIEALSSVGDGRDVPTLLKGLTVEDSAVRGASYSALRMLTHLWMTASPMRWTQWWSKAEPRARAEIQRATREMEVAVEQGADLEPLHAAIQRSGWVDVEASRSLALRWLQSTNVALRAQGFRVASTLRLADLAEEVRTALRFVRNDDAWSGLDAARVLGIPVEGDWATEAVDR